MLPGVTIHNLFNGDLEFLLNVRGLSGNAGKFPFHDCLCSQANRNLPKDVREPCQPRTIESCISNFEKWKAETNSDKKQAPLYKNCVNEPLLTKAFSDNQYQLPIMHICVGLANHDLSKFEDELVNFDLNQASLFLKHIQKEGIFWDFLRFRCFSFLFIDRQTSKGFQKIFIFSHLWRNIWLSKGAN